MMKESTKTIIRTAVLIACMIPYRAKRENDRVTCESLLLKYDWDKTAAPALTIRRNENK